MQRSILSIIRQHPEASVGQTLVRLARLAEAAHRYEAAAEIQRSLSAEQLQQRVSGLEFGPQLHGPGTDATAGAAPAAAVHTEVDR